MKQPWALGRNRFAVDDVQKHSQKIKNNVSTQRPNVLILSSDALFPHFFSDASLKRLSEVTSWTRYSQREDSPSLRDRIAEADVLMTTWHSPFLQRDMLGDNRRLKLIAHCGGEVKSRMSEELLDQIIVTNAADPMAQGVAEMALALMLTMVRRIPDYVNEMRHGAVRTNDQVSEGETLRGRRVGIVGFGRIGRAFSKLVKPLGVELLVADPHSSVEFVASHDARLVELDDLMRACSVLVLAAALTAETRNLFDRRRLSLMRDGAYLINVARGGLIDTDALIDELRRGRITAALDVTDPLEPLPEDHELRRLPNVLLTPHIAAGGLEMRREIGEIAVDEVVRFANGQAPRNRITREMLATMT
ncbi:MAG TPA: hydroxyacid dehydrogenase [Pyrinomonadaceae bacterium]|nr:hydroxyacid dehydrogenase [Pyrinomonadaceae bacterium]